MATTIQFLRSDVGRLRPDPGVLANGVPMVNLNEIEPGLFFSDRTGELFKIGPVAIGENSPNSNPEGEPGNSKGETWLDTSGSSPILKIYDGGAWVTCFDDPGGTVTSVGLTFTELFDVSNTPVTTSGTLTASLKSQTQNTIFSGPTTGDGVPSFRALVANDIPALPASKITTGQFDSGRIPSLDASKITTGTFGSDRIPNLNASKITNGALSYTVGGTGITATPEQGQILIGTGFGWSKNVLTAGANIGISNGPGAVTVSVSADSSFSSVAIRDSIGDTVTLTAPSVTVPYTLKLPSSDGTNGSILTTDGSGQLSFETSLLGITSIGGLGALTINAGGGNSNITLSPTGTGSVDVSSRKIINLAAPTSDNDAANKAYVDTIAAGIQPKAEVEAATTGPVFLTGEQTIDGIALVTGDRVLVKDQASQEDNGIYIVDAAAWTRATDADTFTELVGAITFVAAGATNGTITFLCTSPAGGTIGVDPITFAPYSSAAGTVTSVGLSMPSIFTVSGSPVSSSGTLAAALNNQSANTFLAGPSSGGAATPSFRALTNADLSFTVSSQKYVNVLDYGADNTGATVSNTAFTNAMTAAQSTGKIVFCPPGIYKLNNLPLITGVTIEGAVPQAPYPVGSKLICDNNNSIFVAPAGGVQSVTIRNFWAQPGGNNCKFYTQADLTAYSAYMIFENINTWLDFQIAYEGLFIFTRWRDCVDGYNGNQQGSGHHFIVSWAGTFNPTGVFNQTNINTVEDCYIFRAWGSAVGGLEAAVIPSYGWNFSFWRCDFEACDAPAVHSVGCFGISFRQCWFEGIDAPYVIGGSANGGDNPQGVWPITADACYFNLDATYNNAPGNSLFSLGGAVTGAALLNCNLVRIANGLTIGNDPARCYYENTYVSATTGPNAEVFFAGATSRYRFDDDIVPLTAGAASLGTSSLPWSDVFTQDLHLSNEGLSNDVDGTWGSYTIQEGEEDLFLINGRTGKRYKFLLQEIQ